VILSNILQVIDNMFKGTAASLPTWSYTLEAGSWVTAFMDWMRQYDKILPVHDAFIPLIAMNVLFYTFTMAIRLFLMLIKLFPKI
jgi:hypothetical protein